MELLHEVLNNLCCFFSLAGIRASICSFIFSLSSRENTVPQSSFQARRWITWKHSFSILHRKFIWSVCDVTS